MTKNKVTTPTTAEGNEVTAERLRAFLAHPDVKEGVKARVRKLVGQLYEAGDWDTLPEAPELYALEFEQTYINDHLARGTAEPVEREIYENLAAVIDRHEPKDARLVRLLLSRAFPTDADREDASRGSIKTGSIIDHAATLANELDVSVFHPDILPHALPVIIRAARAAKGRSYLTRALRSLLQHAEKAASE